VSREEYGVALERGKIFGRILVPVSHEKLDSALTVKHESRVGHNGEAQHHLVYLRLAISLDAYYLVRNSVEQGDYPLGCVTLGEIVARTVIKNIAKQKNLVGVFARGGIKNSLAGDGVSVNIGCNNKFHFKSLSLCGRIIF
jgi:hypothetical protein